jgi:predicted MFS family arabinose efflux permease
MLALLGAAGTVAPVAVAAIAIWSAAVGLLPVALQTRVLQLAPDSPDAASALYVATFNAGIGGGALLGGILLAAAGARSVAWAGCAIAVAALALLAASGARGRRPAPRT